MPGAQENITMFQFFEWYTPSDKKHWVRLKEQASLLSSLGLSAIWIPPPMKGISEWDVGYAPYDLWDFGEFDQKGLVATKYGTKDELKAAIDECHKHGIKIYLDAVLNHKAGGDETELFQAVAVADDDRNKEIEEPHDIEAYTKFTFPGRKGKYSDFIWHYYHFSGTDWDAKAERKAVFKIMGKNKSFAEDVDGEKGNFDYLMCNNIDYKHPEVVAETEKWAVWCVKEFGIDGFRIDALKHVSAGFIQHLLEHVRNETNNPDFFAVGEYWKDDVNDLDAHIENNGRIHLFDVPLHFNFARAGQEGSSFDMRTIFDGALVKSSPESAVTFIDNHDTQPSQDLESYVEPWFKPLAAALICLRFDGYPCLFYGDFYGTEPISPEEPHTAIPGRKEMFSRVLLARKEFAYGPQMDYFDHDSCVGWVRFGDEHHPKGLAVVMSNSESGFKDMDVGKDKAGQVWVDMMGYWKDPVTINKDGWGKFHCHAGSVSIWVEKEEGKHWITVEESTPEEQEKKDKAEQDARDQSNHKEQEDFEAPHPELPKPLDDGWEHLLEDDNPAEGEKKDGEQQG
ncbi:glycoside hydrolase superfamily [Mortierella sp. GBAus27b]|nr:glycoside hydrolase superfamily [Mortierella sp. GBAus27b]